MNSNLQNKLQQFSATPPKGVWDEIASALDANSDYAKRLYQYEEQPPAAVWSQLETSLEEQAPAKVIPLTKRFQRPMRYAAVAGLLAVILVTITLTFRRTRAGDLEAENHSTKTTKVVTSAPTKPVQDVYASTKTSGSEEQSEADKSTVTESTHTPPHSTAATVVTPVSKATPVSTRYLLLNGDDGKLVKVSKKMADMLRCKDADSNCQERLRQLRRTLATNAMTSDFTGILEMLRQLQQKP